MKNLIIFLLCIFSGIAHSNDAVKGNVFETSLSYSKSNMSGLNLYSKSNSDIYKANASLTIEIPQTKYLGLNIRGSKLYREDEMNDYGQEGSTGEAQRNKMAVGVDLFIRNSDWGGIISGFDYSSNKDKFKQNTNSLSPPRYVDYNQYTFNYNSYNKFIKGEVYLDNFTIAAGLKNNRVNYDNESSTNFEDLTKTAGLKWYPKDNISFSTSYSRVKSTHTSGMIEQARHSFSYNNYNLNASYQPEFFNNKVRVNFDYRRIPDFNTYWTDTSATYFVTQYKVFNSMPSFTMGYVHLSEGSTENNIYTLAIGLTFDNLVSLKDRDRKYLFSSEF
jgi:hypothetical protein